MTDSNELGEHCTPCSGRYYVLLRMSRRALGEQHDFMEEQGATKRGTSSRLWRGLPAVATFTLALLATVIILPWVGTVAAATTLDKEFLAAVAYGDLARVKRLLHQGADINVGSGAALIDAARRGHVKVLKLLLAKGIDVTATNTYTIQPYNPIGLQGLRWEEPHIFGQSEVQAIARWRMLSRERDRDVLRVQIIGMALIQAALRGHTDIVRIILDTGVDSEEAGFAMKWAALEGHLDIARLLLSRGAAVDARRGDGRSALFEFARAGRTALVKLLLDNHADPDLEDQCGDTALSLASGYGYLEVVRLLLDNGAAVDTQDCVGLTALMRAVRKGHVAIAELLLSKGAQVRLRSLYGWTALAWAAYQGSPELVRALLDSGADVNAKTKHGWTPLMIAALQGHSRAAKMLLNSGAAIDAKNSRGYTALHYAQSKGHEGIAKLLQSRKAGK